ncbi:MAG: 30S ribosomal protein S3 [Clostridium sp.]|nr:30S ribosomal protein S3 [Clostridium sp.]
MGQKTHPKGFRVGIIEPWESTWYAKKKDYSEFVAEDAKLRKYIKKRLYAAGISKILIARKAQNVNITIVTAKPGIVVGRGGQGIEELRADVAKYIKRTVSIDVVEVARTDADAQLVSENIALQLEKRIAFRRAMKQAIQRTMRSGVQGIKIMVSGRLGGAEIARSEWVKEGRIPLQTLRADVDYGFAEADTIMGKIGVKVWIFKGNLMPGEKADMNIKAKKANNSEEKQLGGRRRKRAVETEE